MPILYNELVTKRENNGLKSVELRLDPIAQHIINGIPATEPDYDTEFLDYILAIKVIDSVEQAIDHIALHSTQHSEAIVTENIDAAEKLDAIMLKQA